MNWRTIIKIYAIGDSHDGPKVSKARFDWMNKDILEYQPDAVVLIGDFSSFDSLCRYVPNDTWIGKQKTSFLSDLGSMDDALYTLFTDVSAKIILTKGNHEARINSFSNRNPEVWGMLAKDYNNIIESYNIKVYPFGKFATLAGVNFTHVPLTILGKPMGGKTLEARAANEVVRDLVIGHTHRNAVINYPKMGDNQSVRVINLGSSLPYGHVEAYAKHTLTGWTYGTWKLECHNSKIESYAFTSMRELEKKYR